MKYVEKIAYVLLLIALLMAFNQPMVARYMAAIGAAGLAVCHFRERYDGQNMRLKRLMRIRHLIGLIYIAGSYLMWRDGNYWMVAFFIAVALELYTIYVFEHEEKKK